METIYSCNSVNNTLIELISNGTGRWVVMEAGAIVQFHNDYIEGLSHARRLVYTERVTILVDTREIINARRYAEAQATLKYLADVRKHNRRDDDLWFDRWNF